jgi:hypothetical protein
MKFPLVTAQVTMAVALAQVEFLTAAFCFKQPIVELRRVSAIGRLPKSSCPTTRPASQHDKWKPPNRYLAVANCACPRETIRVSRSYRSRCPRETELSVQQRPKYAFVTQLVPSNLTCMEHGIYV